MIAASLRKKIKLQKETNVPHVPFSVIGVKVSVQILVA